MLAAMKRTTKPSSYKVPLIVASILLLFIVIGFYFLRATPPASTGRLQVVAAENMWGSIARQIAGDAADVTEIISDPAADPHLYESTVRDGSTLAKASIVIKNGLGYDDFIDKLMSASPNPNRSVISAEDVLNIHGNEANPHLWYSVAGAQQVARAIADEMSAKDPTHANVYATNLAKFETSMQPLVQKIAQIRAAHNDAPIAYTERVAGYLVDSLDLQVKTPAGFAQAIEDGNDPSVADQTSMQALIASKQIKLLLYNVQATSPATEQIRSLADEANIPIVEITETIPKNYNSYQQWQLAQLDAIARALDNS